MRDDDRAGAVLGEAEIPVRYGGQAIDAEVAEKCGGGGGRDVIEEQPGAGGPEIEDAAGERIAGAGEVELAEAGEGDGLVGDDREGIDRGCVLRGGRQRGDGGEESDPAWGNST